MALEGRNGVVTGGASGIGRAVAQHLARSGAAVALLDTNAEGAAALARELGAAGGRAIAEHVDVTSAPSVTAAIEKARAALGPIHILVNCAGIADFTPFAQLTEERFQRMLSVHLMGTFHCCQAALPDMLAAGWGRIVNVSSAAALNGGGPGLAHYAAAKAAIIGLTKSLAQEVGPGGVTVNALAPGLIDTPLIRGAGAPEGLYDSVVARIPVRRIGQPEDIAAACAYLVSEEGGFITGQVISPNGGANL